ncbi:transposase [Streptomyces sp. NPDC059982]|uniref:transposase n=1 Tax=unclassified Streptomyces TaxID=2593676 RepID=UPI0036C69385
MAVMSLEDACRERLVPASSTPPADGWRGPRCLGMEMVRQLVPDSLWELFLRVMPEAAVRPRGGGCRRAAHRGVLAAILFVAMTGCTWRQLPSMFGAS